MKRIIGILICGLILPALALFDVGMDKNCESFPMRKFPYPYKGYSATVLRDSTKNNRLCSYHLDFLVNLQAWEDVILQNYKMEFLIKNAK